MSRDAYRGPKLPKVLLEQVQDGNASKRGGRNVSRKDRRKVERQQKKAARSQPTGRFPRARRRHDESFEAGNDSEEEIRGQMPVRVQKVMPNKPLNETKPLKSILKQPAPIQDPESDSEDLSEPVTPNLTHGVKTKLAEDDAEIAGLEKKLGIKTKKSKALELDGLDWIVDGSDDDSESNRVLGTKRKRPEDTNWLRDKRLKARASNASIESEEEDSGSDVSEDVEAGDDDSDASDEDHENAPSAEEGSDEFAAFYSEVSANSDDEDTPPAPKRQRENPYVAPVSKDTVSSAKYVPPSLRKPAASDEEGLRQLRRQIQGLLNRLSEANTLSIVESLEQLYIQNARQHVTSTLVDLLVALISDPSTLNDTFLILHAGFAVAVFKVVGVDFGAYLLEKLVEAFEHHRDSSNAMQSKQTLNLLAFLSCLYNFQLVGSGLIFDYIRLLLEELTESNTELLLRVIRTSGQQLRQDDPSSLKDIVLLLQRSTASIGEDNLSVRTKFMMETINDLKNNRMRAGAIASGIAAEHANRMKKTIGSLNNSRSLKATEPLRITLSDIKDSDKKGKWWLVGASYLDPAKHSVNGEPSIIQAKRLADEDAGYESETPGSVNLNKLARTQGMNTDVRRAIFVNILSSSDHKEAHTRLLKLHLKAKQMLEIPSVLIHCAGAEQVYNPFYALLAHHFCSEHKLRKAFQFRLWDAFREMEGEDEEGQMSTRKVVNLAKLYGSLIAGGGLDIKILKKLDFTYLQEQSSMFVEVLLITLFTQLRKTGAEEFKKAVTNVFARTAGVPGLPQGLLLFLESVLAETELATGKERKTVQKGCAFAMGVLTEAARAAPIIQEDEEDDDS